MTRGFVVVKDKHRTTEGEIKLPVRSDPRSAGYDFYSPVDIVIPPNESRLFFTDVKFIRKVKNTDKGLFLGSSFQYCMECRNSLDLSTWV